MLIDVKNLFKIYHEGEESEVRALDGVSLSVDRGEFLAIIGQSGSGKSTLMNILGCLDIPTYGDYHLDGVDVTELSDRQLAHIRNKQIGFIFQGFNLIPSLNALENVELPLIYRGMGREEHRRLSTAALIRVGLEKRMDHRPAAGDPGRRAHRQPGQKIRPRRHGDPPGAVAGGAHRHPHHPRPQNRRKRPPGGHHLRREDRGRHHPGRAGPAAASVRSVSQNARLCPAL